MFPLLYTRFKEEITCRVEIAEVKFYTNRVSRNVSSARRVGVSLQHFVTLRRAKPCWSECFKVCFLMTGETVFVRNFLSFILVTGKAVFDRKFLKGRVDVSIDLFFYSETGETVFVRNFTNLYRLRFTERSIVYIMITNIIYISICIYGLYCYILIDPTFFYISPIYIYCDIYYIYINVLTQILIYIAETFPRVRLLYCLISITGGYGR